MPHIDMTRKLPRPSGHHSLTPGFSCPDAGRVLEFVQRAFGAEIVERYDGPDNIVFHAEVRIGDTAVMLGSAQSHAPAMPAMLSVHVENGDAVDRTYARALDAGAKSIEAPQNKFYGWRSACVQDVGGNQWTICTVVEELTKAEIEHRMRDGK